MNDLSFQKSPDKSQISNFLLCNYIGLFIPVARLESDRLFKHAQSLQLAGDKSHTILPGSYTTTYVCKQRVVALILMELLSKMRKMRTITPPDANYNKYFQGS